MDFEFASAGRVIFGAGKIDRLASALSGWDASKVLVITGESGQERYGPVLEGLQMEIVVYTVSGEPTVEDISDGVQRAAGCGAVVAIGGGAVMDAGKAIAAVATNGGSVMDYVEVIGAGIPIKTQPLPLIAVPTTAGTGSEVTKNAVIKSNEHGLKVSLRSDLMLPRLAIIDPTLHTSCPADVTAASGMDALTQCIEPYVSKKANALVDVLSLEGTKLAASSLKRAFTHPDDIEARTGMAMAALLSGLSLANAKLGAVHGFAGVLGGMSEANHGKLCATLLPHTFAVNAAAVRERAPDRVARFVQIARVLTGNDNATVDDGAKWLQQLADDLRIPSLSMMGIDKSSFDEIADKSMKASSMAGNPVALTKAELLSILQSAL